MRYKVLEDEKLKVLIQKKEELANQVKEINEEVEKKNEGLNKLVLKLNRLNEKALPIIKEHQGNEELGEYEEYSRLFLDKESGELRLEIIDKIEEYKEFIKQQKVEKEKKEKK
jgi:hypothetical protein